MGGDDLFVAILGLSVVGELLADPALPVETLLGRDLPRPHELLEHPQPFLGGFGLAAFEQRRDQQERNGDDLGAGQRHGFERLACGFGFAGVESMGGSAGGSHDYSTVFRDFEDIFGDFSGIFDSFFGGSGRRSASRASVQRGSDLRYDLEIDFKDAVYGTKAEISYHATPPAVSARGPERKREADARHAPPAAEAASSTWRCSS
ncbi:MAG: hypothetical protein HC897_20310 [Thermoanaerobaculia bacterium]|nr:hypothetical protein [Thermoanaerobaculia bacterium]